MGSTADSSARRALFGNCLIQGKRATGDSKTHRIGWVLRRWGWVAEDQKGFTAKTAKIAKKTKPEQRKKEQVATIITEATKSRQSRYVGRVLPLAGAREKSSGVRSHLG